MTNDILFNVDEDIKYIEAKIKAAANQPPIATAGARKHLALLQQARMKYIELREGRPA